MSRARSLVAVCAATGVLLAAAAPPADAHHSFAVYDFDKQIPFEGVVASLNFKNPHIAMKVRLTNDEEGTSEIVEFIEGAPANMLVREGLRPSMIEPGTKLTAYGSPLREDPSKYFLRRVRLEDGSEYDGSAGQ